MSENNKAFRLVKDKIRCKKRQPRIDLAAMVSVSFLLIIFFMVTKELARPQSMDFGMPESSCYIPGGTHCGGNSGRTVTLLLDKNNTIVSYRGIVEAPLEQPKRLNYGKNSIRKELLKANSVIQKREPHYQQRYNGAIVIIKPTKQCTYGNLVAILDEMAITHIETYAIINDFSPSELHLLASK